MYAALELITQRLDSTTDRKPNPAPTSSQRRIARFTLGRIEA